MSATETVDSTAVDEHEPVGQDVVRRSELALTVTPQIKAGELVERLAMIREAMNNAMVENVDYGKVPGTDKPTLLKPGAEKLGVLFQLDIEPECEETHEPGGHLTVKCSATAFHAPSGARLGKGRGICTTHERKYAYRKQERVCPDCGKPAVIKGREEYGGGWLCFGKKGGCGQKWTDASDQGQAFASQDLADVENPDLPDLWNTVVKMAEKRARVDVVLAVTGASALFTQDLDDQVASEPAPAQASATSNGSGRVSAPAAKRTERVATAKQRGLINARAAEKALSPGTLADIVRAAVGQGPGAFDSQSGAEDWLKRNLDRLPGRLVDAVLEGIEAAESEGE